MSPFKKLLRKLTGPDKDESCCELNLVEENSELEDKGGDKEE